MSKSNKQPHRSTLQTIALVYVILHGFLFWLTARSMPGQEETTLILALFGLASLAAVIAGVAMWFWKRWGLYLYVVATIILAVVTVLKTGSMIMLFGVLLPAIIVLYIFSQALKYFK